MPFETTRYARLSGTTSALTTTSRQAVRVADVRAPIPIEIRRLKVKRAAGAASATYTPRVYSDSAGTSGTISQEYSGTNTASAALFDATDICAYCMTDSSGYIYLQINPDVGGTDTWDYRIDVIIYR